MKITVEAGKVARLPDRRTTSVRGGTYDVGKCSAAERDALLAQPGVREVTGSAPTPKKEA